MPPALHGPCAVHRCLPRPLFAHLTCRIVRQCHSCLSNRRASIVPQALAGLGGFFTLLNASWLCLTNLAAVVVTIPILVLVLIPSCIQFGRGIYVSAAILCLVNVALEVLSCLCYVSSRNVNLIDGEACW
jgi:hypothetical protein